METTGGPRPVAGDIPALLASFLDSPGVVCGPRGALELGSSVVSQGGRFSDIPMTSSGLPGLSPGGDPTWMPVLPTPSLENVRAVLTLRAALGTGLQR